MVTLSETEKQWVDEMWERLDKKLSKTCISARGKLPYTTINGVYDDRQENNVAWWTNGFWGGLMWLMYVGTKNEEYRKTAEITEELLDKAFTQFFGLHHDVGFMWNLTAGVNYRLTGSERSHARFMTAASVLASRYNIKGGFIRAWNGDGHEGWAIIDCMMNIPLLYRAAVDAKDDRFRYIAESHAEKTMKYHVRPDGSVNHINEYDPETGEFLKTFGGQGYGEGSSWSRGQAWAIYGFVLSFIHTGKQEYLDTAKKVAHYFIAAVCDDYLPKSDFRSPAEPIIYDSTAGMIAACGLIEIAKAVPEFESGLYLNAAIKLLHASEEKFADWTDKEESILRCGSESYHGKNLPIIYGDYYFAEAIYKLKGFDMLFW